MAIKLLDSVTAVGVSPAIRIRKIKEHNTYSEFVSLGATKISAVVVELQGSDTGEGKDTGVVSDPVLAIGSTAERVANGAFVFQINNVSYSKAAVVAGSVFTVAHVVTALKYGVINIYINTAGTIITRVSGTDQTAAQAHTSAALAHTAGDTIVKMNDECYLGRILINADAGTWNANTEDMTDASDLTTATFISATSSFITLDTTTFSGTELIAQKSMVHIVDKPANYIRTFLSTLTGTGEVTAYYTPFEY